MQHQNSNTQSEKPYDLEDRSQIFAQRCRRFVRTLPRDVTYSEDGKQLVRSSGSVAANYIEANEAISKKDCIHRMRISRKEAKESYMWLKILDLHRDSKQDEERKSLQQEALELTRIFSSIITKLT